MPPEGGQPGDADANVNMDASSANVDANSDADTAVALDRGSLGSSSRLLPAPSRTISEAPSQHPLRVLFSYPRTAISLSHSRFPLVGAPRPYLALREHPLRWATRHTPELIERPCIYPPI